MGTRTRKIIGWITLSIATLTACFWAYWGIIENFHEGWYHSSWKQNLLLMFFQYLSPLVITIALSILAIFNHKIGAIVFLVVGVFLAYKVNNPIASVPLIILGTLLWFSDFSPKKWKFRIILVLPLLV